jgi:hypothetical protein
MLFLFLLTFQIYFVNFSFPCQKYSFYRYAYLGGRSGVRRPGVDPASSVGEPLAGVAAAAVSAAAAASPARSCVVVAAAAAPLASCAAACAAAVWVLLRGHVRRGWRKVAFYQPLPLGFRLQEKTISVMCLFTNRQSIIHFFFFCSSKLLNTSQINVWYLCYCPPSCIIGRIRTALGSADPHFYYIKVLRYRYRPLF